MRTLTIAAVAASLLTSIAPAGAVPAALVLTCDFRYFASRELAIDCDALTLTHTGSMVATSGTWTSSWASSLGLCAPISEAFGTLVGTSGTVSGLSIDFTLTRVSATGLVTVSGGTTGLGPAVFSNACATQRTTAVLTIVGV